MNLNAEYPKLLIASLLVITLIPQTTEAGLTSYLPSASALNPFSWFWSAGNSSTLVSAQVDKRSDNSTGTIWFNGLNDQKESNHVIKKFQKLVLPNRAINLNVSEARTSTTSTPKNSDVGVVSSIRYIFTTTQRPKLDSNSTSSGNPKWVRVKKKGKLYDTPIMTSFSNHTTQNYQPAYEVGSDEKKSNKITETTEIVINNSDPDQREAKAGSSTKPEKGKWFSLWNSSS